ncbi:MAG: acylphosphatase [Candidatus Bathyarchaeia archaeon]
MARYARAHIFISGRVQGVFFRANARREALKLGVKGWIRNLPDGRVEAVIEGEEDKARLMVEWCKRGPPGAIVSRIEIFWEPYKGEYKSFDIVW